VKDVSNDASHTPQEIAEAWIRVMKADDGSPEEADNDWAFSIVYDMIDDDPEHGWPMILEILRRDDGVAILEVLSAGPLEDLLAKHGPAFIDRVEAEARRNPVFARLLGGVWKNQMTDEIWARVLAVWDRRGWDGVPE
jgi:hypothetical protein